MAAAAVVTGCGGEKTRETPAAAVAVANPVDPATAARVTGTITLQGVAPKPRPINTAANDPYCTAPVVTEDVIVGPGGGLQNVFVYVKDGLDGYSFAAPKDPVVLDQQKCRYTPRVLGIRTGQTLAIRNGDPLLHNVRADGKLNQPFNMGHPIQGTSFNRSFTTSEVMVPFRCDVHAWMHAWIGVVDHPYFGVSGADGVVALTGLPPGTYTLEAWHEKLGTKTQQVTVGAKDSKDVAFTFAR